MNPYLNIKEGVKVIRAGQYKRQDETIITHVHLPSSLKIIEAEAFAGQPIEKIYGLTGTKLRSIGDRAFRGSELVDIEFPKTLESIGDEAFENSEFLQKVTFPKHIYSIGSRAFAGCFDLERPVVYGLISIGIDAFPDGYTRKSNRGFRVDGVGSDAFVGFRF